MSKDLLGHVLATFVLCLPPFFACYFIPSLRQKSQHITAAQSGKELEKGREVKKASKRKGDNVWLFFALMDMRNTFKSFVLALWCLKAI